MDNVGNAIPHKINIMLKLNLLLVVQKKQE